LITRLSSLKTNPAKRHTRISDLLDPGNLLLLGNSDSSLSRFFCVNGTVRQRIAFGLFPRASLKNTEHPKNTPVNNPPEKPYSDNTPSFHSKGRRLRRPLP